MMDARSVPASVVDGKASDKCARFAKAHETRSWQLLGREDNGQWAWRCGNCLAVRYSVE